MVFLINFTISFGQNPPENCEYARNKYLEVNQDVKTAKMDPWVHYEIYGKKEGRIWYSCIKQNLPENCEYARNKYLEVNQDVKNAKIDPWVHYEIYGKKEGRIWYGCNRELVQANKELTTEKKAENNTDIAHEKRNVVQQKRYVFAEDNDNVSNQNNSRNNNYTFCYGSIAVTLFDGGTSVMIRYNSAGKIVSRVSGEWTKYSSGGYEPDLIKIIFQGNEYKYNLIKDGRGIPSELYDNQSRRYTLCKRF